MDHENLTYQERIDHLKAGYDNTQSVVRFLDTKASATVAGLTAVFGLNVAIGNWLLPLLPNYIKTINHWGGLWNKLPLALFIVALLLIIIAWLTLWNAYKTLTPSPPKDPKPSALFPYIPSGTLSEQDESIAAAELARLTLYAKNATTKDSIEDYIEQLRQMGMINKQKIDHCKLAIRWLFIFMAGSVIYAICCLTSYYPALISL